MTILFLITSSPLQSIAWHAYETVKAALQQGYAVRVFFYQDATMVANQLNWRPADEPNLTQAWQALGIALPVCISAALARGITDQDNAQRHQLASANLAQGFELVGLGELADAMLHAARVVQF